MSDPFPSPDTGLSNAFGSDVPLISIPQDLLTSTSTKFVVSDSCSLTTVPVSNVPSHKDDALWKARPPPLPPDSNFCDLAGSSAIHDQRAVPPDRVLPVGTDSPCATRDVTDLCDRPSVAHDVTGEHLDDVLDSGRAVDISADDDAHNLVKNASFNEVQDSGRALLLNDARDSGRATTVNLENILLAHGIPSINMLPEVDVLPSFSSALLTQDLATSDVSTLDALCEIHTVNFNIAPPINFPTVRASRHIKNEEDLRNRANLDTGAWASCTNQRKFIHNYRQFTPENPCPITLKPASEGSDAVPEG